MKNPRKILAININKLVLQKIRQGEYTSLENLAKSTGIQKSLLSRILNLKADPKLSSLDKIAQALKVPISDLLKVRK